MTGSTAETRQESRLEALRAALTAAGVPEPKGSLGRVQSTYEITQGSASARAFWNAVEAAGRLTEIHSESWPCDESELGAGATFMEESRHGVAGVFRGDGSVGLVALEGGELRLTVAGASREHVGEAVAAFRARFPFAAPPSDDLVPVTFWSYGKFGPQSYTRRIVVSPWAEIERNYTAAVRDQLAAMMDGFEPGGGGQLVLWQGEPGTGKTWALRALASEWREWAEVHYVTDPDAFFGEHADYMVEVLLREAFEEDGAGEKWRLLVLEDTGELLASDAKARSGQALSRLLNVVDGLIGQGLRVLVLVTTNDELGQLHPAVSRPGRCAAQIEFSPLTAEEAAEWLGADAEEGATLADLYGRGAAEKAADPSLTSAAGVNLDTDVKRPAVTSKTTRRATARAERRAASAANGTATVTVAPLLKPRELAPGEVLEEGELGAGATAVVAPIPAELEPRDERPEPAADELPAPEQATNAGQVRWEATLVVEGKLTDDGRYIEPGATSWRELPLTLMAQLVTADGHNEARVAGRIDEIWRGEAAPDGSVPIFGRGVFDDSEFGHEVARMVADGVLRGNSVDMAVRQFELAYRDDFDENGHRKPREEAEEGGDEADVLDALFGADLAMVFTDCVIGASTVCSFPAFADAQIALVASGGFCWTATRQSGMVLLASAPDPLEALAEATAAAGIPEPIFLTAAAAGFAPLEPPAEWFDDPELEELTPLTVTDEGRVYGHLAEWDTCHIGIPGVCTTAPHSNTEYAYFHLGEVVAEGGERIASGKITLGTGHAAKHLDRAAATEHYDHTGAVVADVVCGEDENGPWVAGALRPDLPAERVRELRGAVLSGDWRNVNGNLELVGILAVNVPGFPIPRVRALVAAGEEGPELVLALVAAGIPGAPGHELTERDRADFAALAARGRDGLEGLAALARGEAA